MKILTTTESIIATNTMIETQNICTADTNATEARESEHVGAIKTVPKKVERKVHECSVLVNLSKQIKQSTFAEYARTVFVPKVTKVLQTELFLEIFPTNNSKIIWKERLGRRGV